ncbi:hypothetical protein RFI_12701, partial [Reticulomyxa filosa]
RDRDREKEKEKDRSKEDNEIGYNKEREEYEVEWFNDAENYLTGLTMSELDTVEERKLKFALAKYYNDQVLNGRMQRKELLKKHGEKPMGKVKYELQPFVDHFSALMRFCKDSSSSDGKTLFQQFINGIYEESILRQQIDRLQCYLLNGVTNLSEIDKLEVFYSALAHKYTNWKYNRNYKDTKIHESKNAFIDIKKSKFRKHACYNLSISDTASKCISYLFNKHGENFFSQLQVTDISAYLFRALSQSSTSTFAPNLSLCDLSAKAGLSYNNTIGSGGTPNAIATTSASASAAAAFPPYGSSSCVTTGSSSLVGEDSSGTGKTTHASNNMIKYPCTLNASSRYHANDMQMPTQKLCDLLNISKADYLEIMQLICHQCFKYGAFDEQNGRCLRNLQINVDIHKGQDANVHNLPPANGVSVAAQEKKGVTLSIGYSQMVQVVTSHVLQQENNCP